MPYCPAPPDLLPVHKTTFIRELKFWVAEWFVPNSVLAEHFTTGKSREEVLMELYGIDHLDRLPNRPQEWSGPMMVQVRRTRDGEVLESHHGFPATESGWLHALRATQEILGDHKEDVYVEMCMHVPPRSGKPPTTWKRIYSLNNSSCLRNGTVQQTA